jgi:hypothetical protein
MLVPWVAHRVRYRHDALSMYTSTAGDGSCADPIFATFGAATAVMIGISLMVALLVLASLLVLVTPSRVRDEDMDPVMAKEALPVRGTHRQQMLHPR